MPSFRAEMKGFSEAVEAYGVKTVTRAANSTLKKVAAAGKTVASEEIRNRYNIKKSDLDPRLEVSPPRANNLTAEITISGKGTSLSYFSAKQTVRNRVITRGKTDGKASLKTSTRKRSAEFQGVTVEVEKGKRTQLKGAFLARMISGHVGVMRRVTGKWMKKNERKQAIEEKQVISIASMVQNGQVEPKVIKRIEQAWETTFPHELEFQVRKGGA